MPLLVHLTPSDSDHRFVLGMDIIPRLFPEGSISLEYLLSGAYGHVGSLPAHAAILPVESPVALSCTPAVLEQQLLSELESPFSGDTVVVDTHASTLSIESVRPSSLFSFASSFAPSAWYVHHILCFWCTHTSHSLFSMRGEMLWRPTTFIHILISAYAAHV